MTATRIAELSLLRTEDREIDMALCECLSEIEKLQEQRRVAVGSLDDIAVTLENAYGNSSFHPMVAKMARKALAKLKEGE